MTRGPMDQKRKVKGSRGRGQTEEPEKGGWKAWARDLLIAAVIMVVIVGGIAAYTQNWPPLVVVESSSMQHGDAESHLGVIDTGDLVFVQVAPRRADVVTYIQGRTSGYQTYSDYGDVIVFRIRQAPTLTPIIHRAILYVLRNGAGGADVPDLAALPATEWQGVDMANQPTNNPYGLRSVTIHGMGYNRDLGITFDLNGFVTRYAYDGYITMGDNNAYHRCTTSRDPCGPSVPYDEGWFPAQSDIIGHARGEIPWFGLIKLLVSPTSSCAQGWGDPCAPTNSWNDLAISLVALAVFPFALEAAIWAWGKHAWPWLRPRLPYFKNRPVPDGKGQKKPARGRDDED